MTPRRLSLAAGVVILVVVANGCALRSKNALDVSLTASALALQVDDTERKLFDAKVISQPRHDALAPVVLRLLIAAQAFQHAVEANQDGTFSRQEVERALDDLAQVVQDIPPLATAVDVARRFLTQ